MAKLISHLVASVRPDQFDEALPSAGPRLFMAENTTEMAVTKSDSTLATISVSTNTLTI